jgi:hypothetical protein
MGLMFPRRRPVARLAVGAAAAGAAYHAGQRSRPDPAPAGPAYQEPAGPPVQYVPPPAPMADSDADELGEMARLHTSGALSDEEFAAAKAKVLGIPQATT